MEEKRKQPTGYTGLNVAKKKKRRRRREISTPNGSSPSSILRHYFEMMSSVNQLTVFPSAQGGRYASFFLLVRWEPRSFASTLVQNDCILAADEKMCPPGNAFAMIYPVRLWVYDFTLRGTKVRGGVDRSQLLVTLQLEHWVLSEQCGGMRKMIKGGKVVWYKRNSAIACNCVGCGGCGGGLQCTNERPQSRQHFFFSTFNVLGCNYQQLMKRWF